MFPFIHTLYNYNYLYNTWSLITIIMMIKIIINYSQKSNQIILTTAKLYSRGRDTTYGVVVRWLRRPFSIEIANILNTCIRIWPTFRWSHEIWIGKARYVQYILVCIHFCYTRHRYRPRSIIFFFKFASFFSSFINCTFNAKTSVWTDYWAYLSPITSYGCRTSVSRNTENT